MTVVDVLYLVCLAGSILVAFRWGRHYGYGRGYWDGRQEGSDRSEPGEQQ